MLLGHKLRRLLWRARRLSVDLWAAATTVGAAALVAEGWFPDLRSSAADAGPIVAACALGALVVVKVAAQAARGAGERARATGARPAPRRLDIKARLRARRRARRRHLRHAVQLTGGLRSPVYPLVYALVAFVVTFHRRAVGLPLVPVTLAMEALAYRSAVAAGMPERHARELGLSHAALHRLLRAGATSSSCRPRSCASDASIAPRSAAPCATCATRRATSA